MFDKGGYGPKKRGRSFLRGPKDAKDGFGALGEGGASNSDAFAGVRWGARPFPAEGWEGGGQY